VFPVNYFLSYQGKNFNYPDRKAGKSLCLFKSKRVDFFQEITGFCRGKGEAVGFTFTSFFYFLPRLYARRFDHLTFKLSNDLAIFYQNKKKDDIINVPKKRKKRKKQKRLAGQLNWKDWE
jgi:hypothetical protein